MKKTYLQPKSIVVNIKLRCSILEGSVQLFNTTATDAGWTKQDNSWDVWGGDDDDWDE